MLKSLYIKNYALIESLRIDFDSGFSVITGETGAGKSIILGALSLILGQRADSKAIKQGATICVIEGTFNTSEYDFRAFFEDRDIEYDRNTCILRREISSSGKSRAFINDSLVTLNDLKELGNQLIDIHSQHQNLLLADTRFQMQVVDALAGNKELLKDYQTAFFDYRNSLKELEEQKILIRKNKEEEDYLRFQYESLSEAELVEDEQEQLEAELTTLNHAEDIKSALYKVHSLLSDDEHGIVYKLKDSLNTTLSLSKIYQGAEEISKRIESSYIDLKDLSSDIGHLADDVDFNQDRLSAIESRLDLIYSLQRKHHVASNAELLNIFAELEEKINNIDSSDEHIENLEKEVAKKYQTALSKAEQLTDKRMAIIPGFEKELIEKVAYLGMPNIRFECQVVANDELNTYGQDSLLFLFSANKNAPLQPIANIASGGEISRVMLCLKSMIAGATALPTIIFDEIDTGVSGEVADKMGKVMQEFGNKMQVIAITHLPQIAAKGKSHYFVYKADVNNVTTTNLKKLSDDERVSELAQMLSGSEITEAAIQNAKVMLGSK